MKERLGHSSYASNDPVLLECSRVGALYIRIPREVEKSFDKHLHMPCLFCSQAYQPWSPPNAIAISSNWSVDDIIRAWIPQATTASSSPFDVHFLLVPDDSLWSRQSNVGCSGSNCSVSCLLDSLQNLPTGRSLFLLNR